MFLPHIPNPIKPITDLLNPGDDDNNKPNLPSPGDLKPSIPEMPHLPDLNPGNLKPINKINDFLGNLNPIKWINKAKDEAIDTGTDIGDAIGNNLSSLRKGLLGNIPIYATIIIPAVAILVIVVIRSI